MKIKKIVCLSILFFTSHVYADHAQLTDYEMIKSSLLNGFKVRMVVDLKNDCKLLSDDTRGGPPTSPNTFGESINVFGLGPKTGLIVSGNSIFTAPDGKFPANYQTQETLISPDNKVNLILKIVTVPHYKVIKDTRWLCTIGNNNMDGIKFFSG